MIVDPRKWINPLPFYGSSPAILEGKNHAGCIQLGMSTRSYKTFLQKTNTLREVRANKK